MGTTNTGESSGSGYMVSPLSGARCPTGAHPKNTGGKKGRSGRRPGIVKRAAMKAVHERMPFLLGVVDGIALEQTKAEGEDAKWRWTSAELQQRLKAFALLWEMGKTEESMPVEAMRRMVGEYIAIITEEEDRPDVRNRILLRMSEVRP